MHQKPCFRVSKYGITCWKRDAREDLNRDSMANSVHKPFKNKRLHTFKSRDFTTRANNHPRFQSLELPHVRHTSVQLIAGHARNKHILSCSVPKGQAVNYTQEKLEHLTINMYKICMHHGNATPEELRIQYDLFRFHVLHHHLQCQQDFHNEAQNFRYWIGQTPV
uniref:Uncharacterized protein n=1 Tax=Opuntia streptacantha TaxID=393608 RepID=A0A7C9ASP1_OPUST